MSDNTPEKLQERAERFLHDLDEGIAFKNLGKHGKKKNTDLMFHARRMYEMIKNNGCHKAVELGTGHGQGAVLLSHTVDAGGQVFTVDNRRKNNHIFLAVTGRYPGVVKVTSKQARSTSKGFVDEVMKDGKKVDVLFVDSFHARGQVVEELACWLPHLSEKCIVFFHDTVWCHDTVKVLVDDILEGFKVYKFCKDFTEEETQMDWSPGLKGVGIKDGRPLKQSPGEIKDAPDYAKDRKIVSSDYHHNDDGYNDTGFDFKYEMLVEHPGMVTLTKSPRCSWDSLHQVVMKEST